jgi:hypothetical protein
MIPEAYDDEQADAPAAPPLEWRAWPLVEYPGRTAIAVAAVIAVVALVWTITHNVPFSAIGGVIILFSLQAHLLPRDYRLDDNGVTIRAVGAAKSQPWTYFHSYYADKLGVMLSTFSYPSRLDPFRGFNLRFAAGNRDQVVAYVATHLPYAEAPRSRRRAKDES